MFSFAAGGLVIISGRPEQLEGDEGGEGQRNGCAESKGEAVVDAFERLSSAVAKQAD